MIDFWLVYHKLKKRIAKCLQLPCAEGIDWRLSSLVLNLFGNFRAIVLNLVMTENLTKKSTQIFNKTEMIEKSALSLRVKNLL